MIFIHVGERFKMFNFKGKEQPKTANQEYFDTLINYCAVLVLFFGLIVVRLIRWLRTGTPKRACVVVLGDIGRSPRMQYHSLSLADAGYNVRLIGYEGAILFFLSLSFSMLITQGIWCYAIYCHNDINVIEA